MLSALYLGVVLVGFTLLWASNFIQEVIAFIRRRHRVLQLPGPTNRLLTGSLGEVPKLGEDFIKFFRSLPVKYPYCCHLNLGIHRTQVFVYHPETVKAILKTTEPKHHSFLGPYGLIKPWLGEGLIIGSGPRWFRNRRLMTPAFHFDILKPYMDINNSCADALLNHWESKLEKTDTIDIFSDMSLCTLNVILKCAFSYQEDVQSVGENHPYIRAVVQLARMQQERAFTPSQQILSIFRHTAKGKRYLQLCDYVHDVADDVIAKRKKALEEDEIDLAKKNRDFLDILLLARDEDGVGMTDLEIRQEVDTFLFEGHDTTASALSWILYSLAGHPEYQRRAREEVDAFSGGDITWNNLNNMPYTTMCIKEAMRLHSPVPGISRELTQPMTLKGVELLPKTAINIFIDALNHNPAVWGEDHMEYQPDRFLPERVSERDTHAFCPFSAGSRNCIGQNFAMNEIKTVVAKTLQRFNMELSQDAPKPIHVPLVVMRSLTGIHIKFSPRT